MNAWNLQTFSSSSPPWTWPKLLGVAIGPSFSPPFLLPLPPSFSLHHEERPPRTPIAASLSRHTASPLPLSSPPLLTNQEKDNEEEEEEEEEEGGGGGGGGSPMTRRLAIRSAIAIAIPVNLSLGNTGMGMADEEEAPAVSLNLEPYVDQTEGFKLLRPSQWTQVEKSGATVLFEDPSSKGNNIGVVVNPVRITSLKDFGDLDTFAEKLLQAEEKKPSTKSARLLVTREREAHGGVPLYELEYQLDSTRGGVKRVLSAVTVASRKLYILNLAYVDSPEKPLPPTTTSILEQILNSFDLLN